MRPWPIFTADAQALFGLANTLISVNCSEFDGATQLSSMPSITLVAVRLVGFGTPGKLGVMTPSDDTVEYHDNAGSLYALLESSRKTN